jgi:hypothetical protein
VAQRIVVADQLGQEKDKEAAAPLADWRDAREDLDLLE